MENYIKELIKKGNYSFVITECIRGSNQACHEIFKLKRNRDKKFITWAEQVLKEMPNDDMGYCANDNIIVSKDTEECSVGMIRKDRDRVILETRTCESCPYFIPKPIIEAIAKGKTTQFRKALLNRVKHIYIPQELHKRR